MSVTGGCTWQWLQETVKLQSPDQQHDTDAPSAKGPDGASSAIQTPSQVRAAAISSQHVKQTRRLLRLFRHALAEQSSASRPSTPAGRPDSLAQSSTQASSTPNSTVNGAGSTAGVVASAHTQPFSVAHTQTTSPSEPESGSQTVFLVETTIPWELAKFNTCGVPCVFHFSMSPDTLSQQQAENPSISASAVLEDQRLAAEQLVAEALKSAFQGRKLHCHSSIKVETVLT